VFSYSGPGGEEERKQFEAHCRKAPAFLVYYAKMKKKYEWAKKCPWLRIEPDPPPPK
jgi:hypothetical protein